MLEATLSVRGRIIIGAQKGAFVMVTFHVGRETQRERDVCIYIYGYWSKFPIIYLGSHYNTGPYINFPHFGNSNLGKLPYIYIYTLIHHPPQTWHETPCSL